MQLAADYLHKYFKHDYLKCGDIVVSYQDNIQWRRSRNLANMLETHVNGVPSSLLNNVPQVPKWLEYPTALQVAKCLGY